MTTTQTHAIPERRALSLFLMPSYLLGGLLFSMLAVRLSAAEARRDWVKVELASAAGDNAPIPGDLLSRAGAERVADYGAFTIAAVPRGAIPALTAQAARENVRVRVREELDLLRLPGATVDAREGIGNQPPGKLTRSYPPRKPGLFVLQFTGPVRNEWVSELAGMGWVLSRYIPSNGYIAIGVPELAGRTRQLPFVQWLDFFHPYQKAAILERDGAAHEQLFELPAGADSEPGVEVIRTAAEGEIEVYRGSVDTLVHARMSDASAEELLRHEMIISVSPQPVAALSDERQVMSLTSNVNSGGSQPTSPGEYWNWVTERCPECATMDGLGWRIGVVDSGLDDGMIGISPGHQDFYGAGGSSWGRKFFGNPNTTFYTGSDDPQCETGYRFCDARGHGTLVAGIAIGNGGTGFVDSGGFSLGMGVAPRAGVFMTKIWTSYNTTTNFLRLFDWAADAAQYDITIQNHSFNEYLSGVNGTYSTVSRQYDIATRDADDTLSTERRPMLFTVSSGNNNQGTGLLTLPGATAKNVLAVGGLENYRPGPQCDGTLGDSFRNIMKTSRVGTALPGYVKPDVMAPGSVIVSARTSVLWATPSPYCLGAFDGHVQYTGGSGTSFAAPVGAGAALIVKRYLGNAPADTSPALTKAVLIAGARSVEGGEDRTRTPSIPIGIVPSQQQGFGRLSFEDILNGAQKPVVFDQSPDRLFTQAGQVFRVRLQPRSAQKPVKIALVWTDKEAEAFVSNPLVNDLNLEVLSASGAVYVGNRLSFGLSGEESLPYATTEPLPYDDVNNVEYFRKYIHASQQFDVAVKLWNLPGDTDPTHPGNEQDFALVVLNADTVDGNQPIAPVLSAQTDAAATTSVKLSWTPASNMMITGYDVYRGTNLANMQRIITMTTSTIATDVGLPANTAFIYKVVAVGPGGSATSNHDVATTIQWASTVANGTPIAAQRFTELRQGIDYVRLAAGLPTGTWTETIAPGIAIRAAHMNEMRDKLEAALFAIGAPGPVYQYPDPVAGVSLIHFSDITDLRDKVH